MSTAMREPGDWYWIPDEDVCYIAAQVTSGHKVGESGEFKTEEGKSLHIEGKVDAKCQKMDTESLKNMENMVLFNDLSEAPLLHNLRKRFYADDIYTYVGDIVVAVNPFKALPLYTDKILSSYVTAQGKGLPPHIFATADNSYRDMLSNKQNQAICIAGESGAGKTETMKLVLRYLAEASMRQNQTSGEDKPKDEKRSIEKQILETNPLTEAFGNAKTLRNNNSSRFGKWTALSFSMKGAIQGAFITDYLLEKSRVSFQAKGERNYHAFYQLLAGAAERPDLSGLKLGKPTDYKFLQMSRVVDVEGVSDLKEFEDVVEAMDLLHISLEQQDATFRVVASILHLGNVEYGIDDGGGLSEEKAVVESGSQKTLDTVCELLKLGKDKLQAALLQRKMGVKSVVTVPYKKTEAYATRDALCKAMYSALFTWMIKAINKSLSSNIGGQAAGRRLSTAGSFKTKLMIGVLDIFGFEVFAVNSFEQLCINYCNEKLQNHFNNHIFRVESEVYEREGVNVAEVEFTNNDSTLELLEGNSGVFSLIDEEIKVPRGSDNGYLSKLISRHQSHAQFAKPRPRETDSHLSFYVKHFAGDVCYNSTNFLEKNRDTLQQDLQELIDGSTDAFVQPLLREQEAMDAAAGGKSGGGAGKSGGRTKQSNKKTLGTKFRQQLNSLVQTLLACSPSFVRCMKPNHQKCSDFLESPMLLQQLRSLGLLEVCRIRKVGYPARQQFGPFLQRYSVIKPTAVEGIKDEKAACEALTKALVALGVLEQKHVAIGHHKVFMRTEASGQLEDGRRNALFDHVAGIQRVGRGWYYRRRLRKMLQCLDDLDEAVGSCEEAEIDKALATVELELPHQGRAIERVVKAKQVRQVLADNRVVLDKIAQGEMDASDESVLKGLIKSFEAIGAGEDVVDNARQFVKTMESRREATMGLQGAMKAARADPNRLQNRLNTALSAAEGVGVTRSVLEQAQALKAQLAAEVECLGLLQAAIAARALTELTEQLDRAHELGMDSDEHAARWEEKSIVEGKALQAMLQAEAFKLRQELEGKQQVCLKELRAAAEKAAMLIAQAGPEAKAEECEVPTMEALLGKAAELEIPDEVAEVDFARSLVEEVKDKIKSAHKKRRDLEKETARQIRAACKKKNLKMLEQALEKAQNINLREDHPDVIQGNQLVQQLELKEQRKVAMAQLKEAMQATKLCQNPNETTAKQQQCLRQLQKALKKATDLGFNDELKEVQLSRELIAQSNKMLEVKIAKNFLQSNGFASRDWMGSGKKNISKDGKFMSLPPVDLSIVDVNSELWLVYTHYTVRLNPKEPEVMRKDSFMAIMKDCDLTSVRERKGKVMEADMNSIHRVVQSQSNSKRFVFSSFKRALGKIATKVYPDIAPGEAIEKLLSDNILPHASKRVRVSIDTQTNITEIITLQKMFAASLKFIFQFFASMPTKEERKVLKRHARRSDIDEFIGQSLTYDHFMSFASVFSLSSGTGAAQSALTNTDLAAVFLDSIEVAEVDYIGGLTFEEFWQALVRMALVFYARRSGSVAHASVKGTKYRGTGGKTPEFERTGDDDDEPKSETIYDTIVHLLIWISEAMENAVPRAISAQEQFSFSSTQFAMSNQGEYLQRGSKAFQKQILQMKEMNKKKASVQKRDARQDGTGSERDKDLWAVFTYYSTMTSAHPEVLRKDAFLNMMKECGVVRAKKWSRSSRGKLMEAEINSIFTGEAARTAGKRFHWSSFQNALQKLAQQLYPKLLHAEALDKCLSTHVLTTKCKRMRVPVHEQIVLPEMRGVLQRFAPSLKGVFQFFAVRPTPEETQILGRHAKRDDLPPGHQSLTFEKFLDFCLVFGIAGEFSNTEFAAVFLDSIKVQLVNSLGGLTFEEFWEALVRLALLMNTGAGSMKEQRVDEQVLSFLVYISNGDPVASVKVQQTNDSGPSNAEQARFMSAVKAYQNLCKKMSEETVTDSGRKRSSLVAMQHLDLLTRSNDLLNSSSTRDLRSDSDVADLDSPTDSRGNALAGSGTSGLGGSSAKKGLKTASSSHLAATPDPIESAVAKTQNSIRRIASSGRLPTAQDLTDRSGRGHGGGRDSGGRGGGREEGYGCVGGAGGSGDKHSSTASMSSAHWTNYFSSPAASPTGAGTSAGTAAQAAPSASALGRSPAHSPSRHANVAGYHSYGEPQEEELSIEAMEEQLQEQQRRLAAAKMRKQASERASIRDQAKKRSASSRSTKTAAAPEVTPEAATSDQRQSRQSSRGARKQSRTSQLNSLSISAVRKKSHTATACLAPGCKQIHRYIDGYCHLHRTLAIHGPGGTVMQQTRPVTDQDEPGSKTNFSSFVNSFAMYT